MKGKHYEYHDWRPRQHLHQPTNHLYRLRQARQQVHDTLWRLRGLSLDELDNKAEEAMYRLKQELMLTDFEELAELINLHIIEANELERREYRDEHNT